MVSATQDGPPVLVVDDDAASRQLIARSLARAGLDVIQASSGSEALELIATRTFGVVISDVRMPGMSGIDLIKAIRAGLAPLLPIILITGSGDTDSVVGGLDAGANDFLAKPVRLDELTARVRALLRTTDAWAQNVQAELRIRSDVVAALGQIDGGTDPDDAAERVVREIATRSETAFVSIIRVGADGRMTQMAAYNRADGIRRSGESLRASLAGYLLDRAKDGPWVDDVVSERGVDRTPLFRAAGLDYVATAPLHVGGRLVSLLSIGSATSEPGTTTGRQARILAAVVDYASVLEAIGEELAARFGSIAENRVRLQRILDEREFHAVFQPIVELGSRRTVGYEALTRFADGTAPDVRFAEAADLEMGASFELATMATAVADSRRLPAGAFLTLNVAPSTIVAHADEVRKLVHKARRDVVLEVTEHAPIADYPALLDAVAGMGDQVILAVDDAGAGYASLRHILELRPAFAKLDISLVRGIDSDPMRQALAAGLDYYGLRTGCRLIAEGIETQAEADTLIALGIEFGQGYLLGRPARIPVVGVH